ncbi:glycosyltransferase family 4 protein [Sphaerotilus mobilis]|nr:glycosyltransferase [Sphaerotilus mobilis]
MLALLWAQLKGIEQVHLISEPYSTEAAGYLSDNGTSLSKIKAKFRPLIYKLYSLLLLRKISGVFAISRLASLQYQSLGVKESQIAPFGYFVPQIDGAMSHQPVQPPNRPLKVIFVGSLIAIKGLDGLLESVDRVYASGRSIRLDVFGPGDPNLFTWNSQHSIYRGVIPFGLAQTVIRDYDVLVLPSRYDGWGVVVNEAIQSGTPVLCSNRVGAGSVLEKFGCGRVFQLDDSNVELVNILIQLIEQSTLLSSFRQATGEAASKLAPAVAGTYMSEVLEATLNRRSKPACPWY